MALIQVAVLRCPVCKDPDRRSVWVDEREYRAACLGTRSIQEAMPTTPADVREQMMTGIHGQCWNLVMSAEEEE